jgi:hypothetical protein
MHSRLLKYVKPAVCRLDYTHFIRVGKVAAPSRRSVLSISVLNSGAVTRGLE